MRETPCISPLMWKASGSHIVFKIIPAPAHLLKDFLLRLKEVLLLKYSLFCKRLSAVAHLWERLPVSARPWERLRNGIPSPARQPEDFLLGSKDFLLVRTLIFILKFVKTPFVCSRSIKEHILENTQIHANTHAKRLKKIVYEKNFVRHIAYKALSAAAFL